MTRGLFSAIVTAVLVVWAAFMLRVLIDPRFNPPAEIAALGPALITGAFGFALARRKEGD